MKKPVQVTFGSSGAKLRGTFYPAFGTGPFPTVILCPGFPGNDGDLFDLGKRLMKKGFNSIAFNYRGTWGSEGLFTVANSLEDVISAIHYVKSSPASREFNVDASNITMIGYSLGGGMALLGSVNDSAVKRLVYIAGRDLSELGRMMQQSEEYRRAYMKMIDQGIADSGFNSACAEEGFSEIFLNMDKYDLVKHAEALSSKDVLIIGGWRDQGNAVEYHILPLYRALQRHGTGKLQIEIFDTDHSFANVTDQLASRIISWLNEK